MLATLILLGVLLAAAAVALAWVLTLYRGACRQRDAAQRSLQEADAQNQSLRTELAKKDTEIGLIRQTQDHLEKTFKALASDVLAKSNQEFLQLAQQKFKTEQAEAGKQIEARKKEVEALVKPIGETLRGFGDWLKQVEKDREGAYHGLRQLVGGMAQEQQRLRDETGQLVKALRRPEGRGRWGEVQLQRVVELAGMTEHVDFDTQVTYQGEQGPLRPDMVVHLPNDRRVVVDAKAVMDAYLDAIETDDEQARITHLDRHVRQIESRVKDLSGKAYFQQVGSPAFVVLFVPGEAFLYAAVQRKADLMERAIEQGVVIATPSTLVSLLKAVALGWREEQLAENARHISDLGRDLHARLATAFGHLARLGQRLEKTTETYNKLVGSVERQLIPGARRFEEMGVDAAKPLPDELPRVQVLPREPRSAELPAADADD